MLKLYENIKRKRLELGYSQTKLAELTGYADKSMIAKIEKGRADISQSKLKLFAEALHTTPSDLMGSTEDGEYRLIEMFGTLNEEGQSKALEYLADIVASGRYNG